MNENIEMQNLRSKKKLKQKLNEKKNGNLNRTKHI